MNWITYILFAMICAISTWVYLKILIEPGMILGWWAKFLNRTIGDLRKRGNTIKWLHRPLIGCSYCVSGQFALWSYLWLYRFENYNPWFHIAFILLTIFLIDVINRILDGRKKEKG